MSAPGEEPDDRQHRTRRAAEAHERADRARERAEEARNRLAALRGDHHRSMGPEPWHGESTADQATRAEELAAESRRQALLAAERAGQASRASADVHESAALLHDRLADSGVGDQRQHRQQAERHRRQAQDDRVETREDERLRDQLDEDGWAGPSPDAS